MPRKIVASLLTGIGLALPAAAAELGDDGLHKPEWLRDTFKDMSDDLAEACLLAGRADGPGVFNIGTDRFGTMAETIAAVCRHAGTGAQVRRVPERPAALWLWRYRF